VQLRLDKDQLQLNLLIINRQPYII